MNWLQKISEIDSIYTRLNAFLTCYGISGLEQALQLYEDMHQEYIFKNKTSTDKIRISDIYYIEIQGHHMIAHTENATYRKYGSLNDELKILSRYGFIKCRQNCIISSSKIRTIKNNDVILKNGDIIHMSKRLARNVLLASISPFQTEEKLR